MRLVLTSALLAAAAGSALGQTGELEYSWRYYRPGNTGVMGDFSSGLWIAPDGTPHIAGYDPFFEEGGFSRYIESENRWENFSNVDYPVMGDPQYTGSSRINDFCQDAAGALWMGTWRGLLYFDPAVGPDSFVRFDPENSPLGGTTTDVSIAPDGTVWRSAWGNGGGLAKYEPGTQNWTIWSYADNANGWPGWTTSDTAVVQPKPGGGYLVWVDDDFGFAFFDSDTQQFTVLPNDDVAGEIESVMANGCDDAGNAWMLRYVAPAQLFRLDYRTPGGDWVSPPMPFQGAIELSTFQAFGDREAVMIGGGSEAYYFNGSFWQPLGEWRSGGFTYGIGREPDGDVWVSGNGGAAKRDAATGQWQRHRLTNNGQMDNWVRDLSLAPNGDVWFTCNGGPGIGGIGVYDGACWYNFNVLTYGMGGDWPFPCDNADAICFRESTGNTAFNPTNNGLREWDGSQFLTLEVGGSSEDLAEDSLGRLWTVGTYYSLRYHDGSQFVSVGVDGWGNNVVPDPSRVGTVWACANFEAVRTDGSYRFSRETTDFPELNPMHDTLTGVVCQPDGVAWVGSTEGLIRLDPDTGLHEWYHNSNSDMTADQVTPLAVTPDGRVWFTNFNSHNIEGAIEWFDGVNFGALTRAEGLPHEQIWDAEVREFEGGYELWLACASRGIAVLTVAMEGCAADFNGDGQVNTIDVLAFLNAWSSDDPRGDFNGDGSINTIDVLAFLNAWSAGC